MLKLIYLKDCLLRTLDCVQVKKNYLSVLPKHIFFTKPPKMSTPENIEQAKKNKSKLELKEERKKALKQRRFLKKENKEVGFSNDILKQTEYYFENGLRKVYPYYFGWNTTAKERWFANCF